MNKTKIEWTEYTWNPVTGCLKNCPYCYAADISRRFKISFMPTIHYDRIEEPLHLNKPSKIFVSSMGDLFGEWIPDYHIRLVEDIVKKCPHHTFQFLTKNPARYLSTNLINLRNVWIGATATSQLEWDNVIEFFQELRNKPCKRFISAEPLLEEIDPYFSERLYVPDWLIIGACTGTHKSQPDKKWVDILDKFAKDIPVFHKNNLQCGSRKEFPKEDK